MMVSIIDDDRCLREGIAFALRDAGHEILEGESIGAAMRHGERADVVIADVCLPEAEDAGIRIVGEIKRRWPVVEVVVMTGRATVPQAVEAMRLGARSYLQKPFAADAMIGLLAEIERHRGLRQGLAGRGGLVGGSRAMRRTYAQIDLAAACDLPVLVRGESGTGKELAARAIHDLSQRRDRPFIAINCAAIPRELAESEFFGHEAGAFTGATARRSGCFAQADGGTLLLDEVDSLPGELQPKLLRVLEDGGFRPVGAAQAVRCDVRIIAATNADLERMQDDRRFREDLYFRLDGLPVDLPPLRDRPEDIPALAAIILERSAGGRRACALDVDAAALLAEQPWPGNVRELAHLIRRAAVRAEADQPGDGPVAIRAAHLGLAAASAPLPFKQAQERAADAWARRTVVDALARSRGSMAKAAEMLGMHRCAIYRLLKRLDIPLPAERADDPA